jgi:hypothetical protein
MLLGENILEQSHLRQESMPSLHNENSHQHHITSDGMLSSSDIDTSEEFIQFWQLFNQFIIKYVNDSKTERFVVINNSNVTVSLYNISPEGGPVNRTQIDSILGFLESKFTCRRHLMDLRACIDSTHQQIADVHSDGNEYLSNEMSLSSDDQNEIEMPRRKRDYDLFDDNGEEINPPSDEYFEMNYQKSDQTNPTRCLNLEASDENMRRLVDDYVSFFVGYGSMTTNDNTIVTYIGPRHENATIHMTEYLYLLDSFRILIDYTKDSIKKFAS